MDGSLERHASEVRVVKKLASGESFQNKRILRAV